MQNGLEQLRDIHLPAAIGNWPPAIGWWLVPLLSILLISILSWLIIRHRRNNTHRRQALVLLENRYKAFQQNQDAMSFLSQSNEILKRFCLHAHPQAVSLSSAAWADFLSTASKQDVFSVDMKKALSQGIYQAECHYDLVELYCTCKLWIKSA